MHAYLRDLNDQLRRRGVPRRARRRILTEAADHLQSDAHAVSRFGEAAFIAQRFSDEMGWRAARRSALEVFAALAVAGVLLAALGVAWSADGSLQAIAFGLGSPAPVLVAALLAVAPQVSFAAGTLAVLRVWRRSGSATLPATEVRIVRRRTAVALLAGLATMAALASYALLFAEHLPPWSARAAVGGALGAALLLLACGVPMIRAWRYQVAVDGGAGDVFVDIGARFAQPMGRSPWVFAALVSSLAGLIVFGAGLVAADGFDGALRGLAEGTACLTGFAVFSRYLGMRAPNAAAPPRR